MTAPTERPPATVTVIGLPPDLWTAPAQGAAAALAAAALVAVAPRLRPAIDRYLAPGAEVVSLEGGAAALGRVLDQVEAELDRGRPVTVVASGDPGYFGIGRALAERLGAERVHVLPGASSVATAFGRAGLPWDDAVVVSAHGRPLGEAVAAVVGREKVAVLTAPGAPPGSVGRAIVEAGGRFEHVIVASDLGAPSEQLQAGDLDWLATIDGPPMSVVLLWNGSGVATSPAVASPVEAGREMTFGRLEDAFEHRDGMITKAEVRAYCLALLELPVSGVVWDVGAGSGSVAVEAALLSPGCEVFAVERSEEAARRIEANAASLGARVRVVNAEAPTCLADLPAPDRIFVGGGGLEVLRQAFGRLSSGGRAVATFASLEHATEAGRLLGNLTQLSVSRGARLPDGSWRLRANDPVFVCWGER